MPPKSPFQKAAASFPPSTGSLAVPPSSPQVSLRTPPRAGYEAPTGRILRRSPPSSRVVPREGELILDYPTPLEPVTALRSTLITSSLTSLRARGLFERYDALQTTPHRQTILNLVAGEWLGPEVALAHYQTCDALGLEVEEQIAIGKDVSARIHETFLSLVVKAARGVGMTPWLLLPKGNSVQRRLCVGGGIRIFKLGPKSARIELARMPHLAIPYARHGVLGIYTAAVELLATNVTARIVKTESGDPTHVMVLRIDWG